MQDFFYADETQHWFEHIFANHLEEARSRALTLVEEGDVTGTGYIETPTLSARKVRFKCRQMPAYRFIFCILNQVVADTMMWFAIGAIIGAASILTISNSANVVRTCKTNGTSMQTG